ncbi:MAG: peptidoglycan-binding protein [Chloroflexota bacterium]
MRPKRILVTVIALAAALSVSVVGAAFAAPLTTGLHYGSRGDQVRALQTSLGLLGYPVQATGYFGGVTLSRVMQFQSDNGLAADGYVGPLTRAAIEKALYAAYCVKTGAYGSEDLTVGDVGPAVERLQRQLISLGYDPGPVTAVFDARTGAALMQLQSEWGLAVTEIADRATFVALGVIPQPKPEPSPAPAPTPTPVQQPDPQPKRVVKTADGRQLAYSRVIDVVATAYDATPESNGQWGPYAAYDGARLKLSDIAVDPNVIPLGTRVYVTGYSSPLLPAGGFVGRAVDTGSAIKGNRIDIYTEGTPAEVSDFGMQDVKVYILEQN